MENEQCGICWNLKYDKQGDHTHRDRTNFHEFVSLDFCVKCNKPKYDQSGFQTHYNEICDFIPFGNSRISHKFISGIQAKYQEKQRRKKNIFTAIGIVSLGAVLTVSLSNLFF